MGSLAASRPNVPFAAINRVRALMEAHVGDVSVAGYENLIGTLMLPDPDDRHVLAAAIHGKANVIVTSNLKDFPDAVLAPHQIRAQRPDDFILSLSDADAKGVALALAADRSDLVNPTVSVEDYLTFLERSSLPKTVAALRSIRDLH